MFYNELDLRSREQNAFIGTPPSTRRVTLLLGSLLAGNLLIWLLALILFRGQSILIATAVMAYVFGLRHALDADHIAAIDNVTRKLVAEKQRPLTVGLFFSLGHSTVVIILSALVALGIMRTRHDFPVLEKMGTLVGTGVSALFLLGIAAANVLVLRQVLGHFRAVRGGSKIAPQGGPVGPLAGLLRPLLNSVDASWKMYPIGFLFGLGFDTATEIGLLGIAAAAAMHHLPLWGIMLFPALFTAGMSLVDTLDGVIMSNAYGWAMIHPVRKVYYNIAMTGLSIILALVVGLLESLDVVRSQWKLHGWFWGVIGGVTGHWETLGLLMVLLFMAGFAAALLLYRRMASDCAPIADKR